MGYVPDRLLKRALWSTDAPARDGEPGRGREKVSLWRTPVGWRAVGTFALVFDGKPLDGHYEVLVDDEWRTEIVDLVWDDRPLRLLSPRPGEWRDARGPLPELRGCLDVDFAWSAFTNTLPIRRLKLVPGESRDIDVVYVDAPSLIPQRVRQRYTCLDPHHWRYEASPGFLAEIDVDDEGLVVDYPGVARRLDP